LVAGGWAPEAGDIAWLHLDPRAGHEQAGHRPAVVLSPLAYNRRTGLMLCVPLTTRIKGYPFEVEVAGAPASVALADQVKCLDWRARGATGKAKATATELLQIRERLATLLW
jgi:mRNA interferase MazF